LKGKGDQNENERRALCFALLASIFATSWAVTTPGIAQDQSDNEDLMRSAGSLQAVAELCGLESEAKLLERKQQLVSTAAKRGISADRFESLFSSGLAETRRKLAAATPKQREQTCEQVAKFRAM
jgi:predicted secreted protein